MFLHFLGAKGLAQDLPYSPKEGRGPLKLAGTPAASPSYNPGEAETSTTITTTTTTPYSYTGRGPSNVPAGIPWHDGQFNVLAQDQDLRDLLRQFATAYGIRIVVSDKIEVKVSGRFEGLKPEQFLEQICRAYNLMTFYDGNMLYVYRNDESTSKIIQMRKVPPSRLLNVLRLLGLTHPAYAIRAVEDEGILMVSGPPKFLQTVEDLAVKMDASAQAAPAEATLRIFYLKNAWANDLTFDYRDSAVTVPGVVTSLQNLMAGGAGGQGSAGSTTVSTKSGTVPALMGKGLASVQPTPASGKKQVAATALNNAKPSTVNAENSAKAKGEGQNAGQGDGMGAIATTGENNMAPAELQPVIQADVRLNAVIVRDTKEKMGQYEMLIDALDQPVEVIEITAAIVDVQSTYTYQLGIDWSLQATGTNSGIGIGNAPSTSVVTGPNGGATQLAPTQAPVTGSNLPSFANLIPGSGLNFSTVIVDSGLQFLSNVKALESQGRARTLSRPSVLTLDNVEALIQREETAYVKVNGFQAVDLFNVSTGVKLKVTPHIIDDHGRRKIKLVVDIQDGSFTASSTTDGVPNVQESNINTQSVIMERQSLLVGGIFREEDNKSENGIPFIRRVPLLGSLFKVDTRKKTKLERLFLITPRIVKLSQSETRVPTVFDNNSLPEAGEAHPAVTSSNPARKVTEIYPPDGPRDVEGRGHATSNLRTIAKPEPDLPTRTFRSSTPPKLISPPPPPLRSRTVPARPEAPLHIPPFSQNQGQDRRNQSPAPGKTVNDHAVDIGPAAPSSRPVASNNVSAPAPRPKRVSPAPAPVTPSRTPSTTPASTAPASPTPPSTVPINPDATAKVSAPRAVPVANATIIPMGDGGYAEPAPTATAVTTDSASAAKSKKASQRSKH
ncbi:MAG TPA: type III secretion system outer membrane ring subunit SctC [Candidatus Methylacidiphilales bacterium]|nr:type III secretion system outer membrane ring subunit SctC [Candidatus Methylacidiphilales bacterium]